MCPQTASVRVQMELPCISTSFPPDSSYNLTTSNIPVAPEPNDVYRHALCPSSSLRPNAPFQLLRTGRWGCAPGGCANRSVSFSSSLRRVRNLSPMLPFQESGSVRSSASPSGTSLCSGAHDFLREDTPAAGLVIRLLDVITSVPQQPFSSGLV